MVTESTYGTAILDTRFQALQTGATELLVRMSGTQIYCGGTNSPACPPCYVFDVAQMMNGRCAALSASTSITSIKWAHDENSGCSVSGGDYSLILGVSVTRRTYVATLATNRYSARTCARFAGAATRSAGGWYTEFQYAAVWLKHGT